MGGTDEVGTVKVEHLQAFRYRNRRFECIDCCLHHLRRQCDLIKSLSEAKYSDKRIRTPLFYVNYQVPSTGLPDRRHR